MKEIFTGELEGEHVIVKDGVEAGKIHNKGGVGRFRDGKLILSLTEAFHLMNEKKLEIKGHSREELIRKAVEMNKDFEIRYIAYRDLRKRGFLVEDRGSEMLIWRGGESEKRLLIPVYERVPFVFEEIYSMASSPVIFGIVDGDGDLTYYIVKTESPEGPVRTQFDGKIEITILEEMGFTESMEAHKQMYYGKSIDGRLHLSMTECIYLAKKGFGALRDIHGDPISIEEVMGLAMSRDPEFPQKLSIYSDLRDRGLIVRTGFKYGTHFRVYVRDVEHHAPYLVHAVPERYTGTWPEISRGVRLAHGVKKDFLLAEASNPPKYLKIKRVRL